MHGRKNHARQGGGAGSPPSAAHDTTSDGAHEVTLPAFLTTQADGVSLAIKLQPRASKNEIGEASGAELRIKVTAPPVDAAANEALLHLLADKLDCSRGKVELIRGHTARHKVVKVYGMTASEAFTKLDTVGA